MLWEPALILRRLQWPDVRCVCAVIDRKRIQFAEVEHSEGPPTVSSVGSITGQKKPPSARRKKSIRIILEVDDEKDLRSDCGSIASMLGKARFEPSPTTPVTPMDSKGSAASNDTSMFDDKVSHRCSARRLTLVDMRLMPLGGQAVIMPVRLIISVADAILSHGSCVAAPVVERLGRHDRHVCLQGEGAGSMERSRDGESRISDLTPSPMALTNVGSAA